MLRQTFSVFEPEQCLIEISSYFGRWNWCVYFVFCFVLVHPDFWLCDYCNIEMKKCQCYLIYDKASDVAL